jgi:ATP-binding cassette subfamily C protein
MDRRVLLANVTFDVEAGDCVAIVGPSGAGKSTLVRALAGAITPAAGVIRYDGADQRNWDSEALAEHIGYMPQEPSLFIGTIKENISRFAGLLSSDEREVDQHAVAAAQAAGAHDMILRLPGGYDHRLGLGGRGLSVGQAQRIALARALYRNPTYLILDEPNANLDAEGDQQLIQTLSDLKAKGSTILVVAHRLSVLPIIDKLMVIRDGRLAMFGPRDQIMAQITPSLPPARAAGAGKGSK